MANLQVGVAGNGTVTVGAGASVHSPASNILTLGTNGDERIRIAADGKVGIGEDVPTQKLHLHEATSSGNFIQFTNSTTGETGNDGCLFGINSDEGGTIWHQESNYIRFGTSDTERVRITSGGNIGVNATAASNKVEIIQDPQGFPSDSAQPNATVLIKHGTSGTNRRWIGIGASLTGAWIQSSSPGGTGLQAPLWINRGGGEVRMGSSGTKLFVKHGGNIGVNTDAPAATTHISKSYISGGPTGGFDSNIVLAVTNNESASNYAGLALNAGASGGAFIHFGDTADSNIGILYYDHSDNSMRFSTNTTERMRIDTDGDLCVGTTGNTIGDSASIQTNSLSVEVGGDVTSSRWNRTDANEAYVTHRFSTQGNSSGHIQVNVGSVTYSTSSDYRLKENIVDLTGAITRVKTLKPKRFNFKIRPADTLDGFLAHEASTIVPDATTGTKDQVDSDNNPVYQGMDNSKLVPLLTGALQEAITKIETLETKVAALESA